MNQTKKPTFPTWTKIAIAIFSLMVVIILIAPHGANTQEIDKSNITTSSFEKYIKKLFWQNEQIRVGCDINGFDDGIAAVYFLSSRNSVTKKEFVFCALGILSAFSKNTWQRHGIHTFEIGFAGKTECYQISLNDLIYLGKLCDDGTITDEIINQKLKMIK